MNAWDGLPNAAHIDWVLADFRQRPERWDAAWDAARDAARAAARAAAWDAAWDAARAAARAAAWDAAWDAAWAAARAAAWDAAWDAAWAAAQDAAWDAAWAAVRDVCAALIAFDYAGAVLDMPKDAVRLLKANGDPAATLLLPSVIVRSQS